MKNELNKSFKHCIFFGLIFIVVVFLSVFSAIYGYNTNNYNYLSDEIIKYNSYDKLKEYYDNLIIQDDYKNEELKKQISITKTILDNYQKYEDVEYLVANNSTIYDYYDYVSPIMIILISTISFLFVLYLFIYDFIIKTSRRLYQKKTRKRITLNKIKAYYFFVGILILTVILFMLVFSLINFKEDTLKYCIIYNEGKSKIISLKKFMLFSNISIIFYSLILSSIYLIVAIFSKNILANILVYSLILILICNINSSIFQTFIYDYVQFNLIYSIFKNIIIGIILSLLLYFSFRHFMKKTIN